MVLLMPGHERVKYGKLRMESGKVKPKCYLGPSVACSQTIQHKAHELCRKYLFMSSFLYSCDQGGLIACIRELHGLPTPGKMTMMTVFSSAGMMV